MSAWSAASSSRIQAWRSVGAEGVGPVILGEKVIADGEGGGNIDTAVSADGEQRRYFHFHAHNSLGLVAARLRHGLPVGASMVQARPDRGAVSPTASACAPGG